ncbi:MAG: pyrroloquinoline-quinone synthase PqqC [Gemmatimonadetes bacterium]|nr:pyrroloquinoline-quinone synthase PqqC [Gemmatimonadota bacterium]
MSDGARVSHLSEEHALSAWEEGDAWAEAEFVERLRSRGTAYYDTHPFHLRMHRGELSREQLAGWVANRFCYQRSIPLKDAAILSNCPDRDVRRRWIQRIHDHDGAPDQPGGLEAWLVLAEAVGLSREEVWDERHVVPGVRFACEAYIDFCRRRPWVQAVASSLTELFAPDLMSRRIAAFEKSYPWLDERALGYFRSRLTQAPRDSEHGLEIVVTRCRSRRDQEAALAALDFKLDVLWSLLDAVHYRYVVAAAESGDGRGRAA